MPWLTSRLKKIYAQYTQLPWERKILWSGVGLAGLPILAAVLLRPETPAAAKETAIQAQVDTYIPKGFVLIPIDVQNYEALDSILGKFGVVDLLQTANSENPRQHLVARNVRILRAPQNPSHFAILVEESQTAGVLKYGSQFTVIVKSRGKAGTEFVKTPTRRTISYEGE